MKSVLCIALLVVLGVFCASTVSATELVTPELQDHLSAVHEAVFSAEESLRAFDADDEAMQAEDALSEETLAFLEMHADMDSEADVSAETDADVEMEAAFGIDEEDNEAFLETDADADADSDAEAEAESGVAGTVVMKMEQGQTVAAEAESLSESEANAEAGSVTVPDLPANHDQDADPIVSEQMEMQAAIDSYQMLEADSEAEVEAELEAEADTEAEAEAETELEAEAEPLPEAQATEDGVAYTKCGKKIIYEKKEETAPEAAPEMQ